MGTVDVVVEQLDRSRRVLVVDDHPDAAEVVCTILRFCGLECRMVHSGTAALAEASGFDPSLVILDLSLPDMNGFDLSRALKARPGTHVAALTGWDRPGDREAAAAAGCDQFIVKPADAAKIRGILATRDRLAQSAPRGVND